MRKFPGSFIRITRRSILKQLAMIGIFTGLKFEVIIILTRVTKDLCLNIKIKF